MAEHRGARTTARAVASAVGGALPPRLSDPLRRAARRLRSADARRVAGGARAGAGQLARTLPGAARVLGTRWNVRVAPWSTVTVNGPAGTVTRSLTPDDAGPPELLDGALAVRVPDAAALVRLAASGLLAGTVRSLTVRVDRAPAWLSAAARVTGPDPGVTRPSALSWRSAGQGVDVTAAWERPAGVVAALETSLRAVLRTRPWPQAGGPMPVTDRVSWTDGTATPAQGVPLDARPVAVSPGPGPLRPFTDPSPWSGPHPVWSPVGAVAFPHRRRLLGEPARYRLTVDGPARVVLSGTDGRPVTVLDGDVSPEAVLSDPGPTRYATVELPEPGPATGGPAGGPDDGPGSDALDSDWVRLVSSALATAGLVLVPTGPSGRRLLAGLGIPSPGSAAEVTGPDGYAWSALVSRTAGVLTESTLRRTALGVAVGGRAPDGALLPLPAVSVLVASMRPDTVVALLTDLSRQTYPSLEVVLGTHGWTATAAQLDHWSARLGHPLRAVARSSDTAFGDVLGALSRTADGDVLTKADDDDVYGPDHLTDLVLAWRQTGADLVAKAPRFVHLEDPASPTDPPTDPRGGTTGTTVDRSWAATEVFDRTPAGGTLLAARSTLLEAGGWSGSVRHVDIDLTARIRQAGGVTYRTHGLGYVYVRHARGHTWEVDRSLFMEQAGDVMAGLPAPIATGRPTGYRFPDHRPTGYRPTGYPPPGQRLRGDRS